jgi:FKBP-type peptidyl-prolyl cis-trans isomerase FklB
VISVLHRHQHTIVAAAALGLFSAFSVGTASAATTSFKNDKEKTSYMIGYQIGSNFKRDGLEVDLNLVQAGMKEAIAGDKSPISEDEQKKLMDDLRKSLTAKAEAKQKEEGDKNKKAGADFLAKNKKEKGVTTLPSGLQYKVVTEGKGDSPKATDTVKVHYKGTLTDGTEFDSSYKRGQPAEFPVNGVIKGWTEALQLMKPGSKWQLWIPSDLAYGDRGMGDKIGPNSVLVFDVELLEVVKPKAEEKKP